MNQNPKKRLFFRYLTYAILTLIVFLAAVLYISKNANSFRKIFTLSWYNVAYFFILQMAMTITNALVLIIYMEILKNKISFTDATGLTIINTFFNNVAIKGGTLARGYFLKKIHNFSYTNFIFTLSTFALIELISAGFIGICCLIIIYFTRGYLNLYLFLLFIVFFIGSIAATAVPLHKVFKNNGWLGKKLIELNEAWVKIKRNKNKIRLLFLLSFSQYIIFALRFKYGFQVLYGHSSLIDSLLISTIGILSFLLSITPGGIGIREFLTGATYKLINGNMVEAVVITALDRLISTVVFFILGMAFIFYFLKKINAKNNPGYFLK